jgi:hypothetical protein
MTDRVFIVYLLAFQTTITASTKHNCSLPTTTFQAEDTHSLHFLRLHHESLKEQSMPMQAMQAQRTTQGTTSVIISELDGSQFSASCPGRFTPAVIASGTN